MIDQQMTLPPALLTEESLPVVLKTVAVISKYPETLAPIALQLQRNLEATSRHLVEAGSLLIQAKAILAHGQFKNWLQENFRLSSKTANRLMGIAKMVKKLELNTDNIASLMNLDLSVLYEISAKSTTEAVQRQVFDEIALNHPISYEMVREFKKKTGQNQTENNLPETDLLLFMRVLKQFSAWFDIHRLQLHSPQIKIQDELKIELETYAQKLKAASEVVNDILEQTHTFPLYQLNMTAQVNIESKPHD